MQPPPILPEETLRRVLRLARFDGMSVLIIAGAFGLLSAVAKDHPGAIVGMLVAGAGAVELHGVALLRAARAEGMNWLVGSQLFLMAAMLGYCAFRLTHVVIPPIPPNPSGLLKMLDTIVEMDAQQLGITKEECLRFVYRLSFQLIAAVTVVYQGSMSFYYLRRRAAVVAALPE